MGFCTEDDVEEFFRSVPEFERMLVHSGIMLIKFDHRRRAGVPLLDAHSRSAQAMEALPNGCRVTAPLGALHQGHVESRRRWELYTKAKEVMLERTSIPEAPWWIVEAVDKKRARLNCIRHLLSIVPHDVVSHAEIVLPERAHSPDYFRHPIPKSMYVPTIY